jgi:NAD(P)-dependent dehydrogenase (short-subunit alcohol dehydrogenase family)
VIDINLMRSVRHTLPEPGDAGSRGGQVRDVNMASIHGMVVAIGNGAYTAANHGVVGLTRNAAAEYGPHELRINCVGPAYIETRCWRTCRPTSGVSSSHATRSAGWAGPMR